MDPQKITVTSNDAVYDALASMLGQDISNAPSTTPETGAEHDEDL
ncbi:hypothetical protein [Sphaerimonospora mesophila]